MLISGVGVVVQQMCCMKPIPSGGQTEECKTVVRLQSEMDCKRGKTARRQDGRARRRKHAVMKSCKMQ